MTQLNRREFLSAIASTTVAGSAALAASRAWAQAGTLQPRPNILFLLADDQRFDTIAALGNRQILTPNLDRLVREGTTFDHTFVEIPICTPSRAALLTGCSGFRNGVSFFGQKIDPALPTWPAVMRQAGYTTFFTGKWHNDGHPSNRGFAQTRRVFPSGMGKHQMTFREEGREVEGFSSQLFADAAIEFLCSRPSEPFFAYVSFTAPHDPRTPPPDFQALYNPDRIHLPSNFLPEHPFDNGELRVRDEQLLPWPRTEPAVRREIANYYAMISHLDQQIGRILKALDDTGLADNTLVVFAGDNGLAVGQHGLLGKQSMYDHSTRVPLIFRGRGVPRGQRSHALCYLYDLLPTACDWAGLPIPDTVQGRSLAPVLRNQANAVRDSVFCAYRDVQRMVRTDRWKLIQYPEINRTQLFDLASDPWEMTDLASDPAHAPQRERLRKRLAEWQASLSDPLAGRT